MKLYNMNVYQKIDYLISGYYYEHEMLEKLVDYIDEEALEKAVADLIKGERIPGFEKEEK